MAQTLGERCDLEARIDERIGKLLLALARWVGRVVRLRQLDRDVPQAPFQLVG